MEEPQFLLDPYIVRGGITFLWAKSSVGKSPLTWAMAASIGSGSHFYGLPTTQARVLYIEVDTPMHAIVPRLKRLTPPPPNVWWHFLSPISVPSPRQEDMEGLLAAKEAAKPEVVFVNTLRKVHDLDDKDSKTPKIVYSFFQHLFPTAALVFIHHARKSSPDPKAIHHGDESFSGAMNWINDAQVGLHLERYSSKDSKENLRLYHSKSQISPKLRPMPLHLAKDGTTLTSPRFDQLIKTYEILNNPPDGSKLDLDQFLAKELGVSITTARRNRYVIEAEEFPGSRRFMLDTATDSDTGWEVDPE